MPPGVASWIKKGRPVLVLSLSDRTIKEPKTFVTRFTPGGLSDEDHVQGRLIRFWGDVLQYRTERLLEPILESIKQHESRP